MAMTIIVWKPLQAMILSLLLLLVLWSSHGHHNRVSAWTVVPILTTRHPSFGSTQSKSTSNTQLHYVNDGPSDADLIRQAQQQQQQPAKDTPLNDSSTTTTKRTTRASIEGVSLAPQGFWAMLRLAVAATTTTASPDDSYYYLPLQVTDDPADASVATSPEALTLLQLLSGVDMAGAILPPEVLAHCVVLECETIVAEAAAAVVVEEENTTSLDASMLLPRDSSPQTKNNNKNDRLEIAQTVLRDVQASLPDPNDVPYSQAHEWLRARATLPVVSLDEVVVVLTTDHLRSGDDNHHNSLSSPSFVWKCQIARVGSLTFKPSNELLEAILYQFSAQTSLSFVSLALALRYQAPLTVLQQSNNSSCFGCLTLDHLQHQFPLYATRQTLQATSHRVQENIVRSFEIHKLTGALEIARKRGDRAAAAKIRAALDELDSLKDLPTTTLSSDLKHQDDDDEDGEDLNVLQ